MQLLITFKGLDKPPRKQDGAALQHSFEQLLLRALASTNLVMSAAFSDSPGGFLIVDVDEAESLAPLLSLNEADDFYITVNHISAHPTSLQGYLTSWSMAGQTHGPMIG
ncbi:MAG: hypothetical protein Q8R28_13060 [Dehalococcoidia bacterium]|nr:hypothetical protein [Dehalococcoidia bacterium]